MTTGLSEGPMRHWVYEALGVRTLIGKCRLDAGGDMPGTPSHWLRNESQPGVNQFGRLVCASN
jgi:hypothetical protein